MGAAFFTGWEYVAGLGALILVIGLVSLGVKRRPGIALVLIGILWFVAFGLYSALLSAGIYPNVGPAAGYVPNLIGVVLIVVGLGVGYTAVRVARKSRGG